MIPRLSSTDKNSLLGVLRQAISYQRRQLDRQPLFLRRPDALQPTAITSGKINAEAHNWTPNSSTGDLVAGLVGVAVDSKSAAGGWFSGVTDCAASSPCAVTR